VIVEIPAKWEVPSFEIKYWEGKTTSYCVVVPVINEGARLGRLLARMKALDIAGKADIIIVDGGTTDGSLEAEILRNMAVRGLILKTGPGKLSAQLRCAYAFALLQGYEGIVTIDGNDKDDPSTIPIFLAKLTEGVDFVQASRFLPGGVAENTPALRDFAIRFIHAPALRLASGFPWTDTTQGYRAYSRKMLMDARVHPFRNIFMKYELLAYLSKQVPRLGFRCLEVATGRKYPKNEAVPTKIKGLRGNFELLMTLMKACFGDYDV
jgi:glycosyltransferase involved in cell wall biosynthesis